MPPRRGSWRALIVPVTAIAMLAAAAPAVADGPGSKTPSGTGAVRGDAADPVVPLEGRGFGHGRGMSQWGARAMASQGRTVRDITAFYYPGTTTASIGNPTVRVRLTSVSTSPTTVAAQAGLVATDGSCTAPLTSSTATSWRVARVDSRWQVQSTTGSGWSAVTTSCPGFASAPWVGFVGGSSVDSSILTLRTPNGDRRYRGMLRASAITLRSGGVAQSTTGTVNALPMDRYLMSVVPAEMPASWAIEAVKAQAVAARTYTAARLGSADGFDICDTTTCQVYPGLTSSTPEHANSTAAVQQTSGQVLHYGGRPALTEFSSSNGGQVTGSSLAYQVAKADPYDGVFPEAPDTWALPTLKASTIEKAWPGLGRFRSLTITRDGKGAWYGGRATSVTVTGTYGSRTVTGDAFRSALGLRSTWFRPTGSGVGTDWLGNGFSDLVVRDAAGAMWSYPTDGRGALLPRVRIGSGWAAMPEIVAPGDFSGDGVPDLITRSTTTGALTLHRGHPGGWFASQSTLGTGWQGMTAVVAPGDLDGDGKPDLLARDAAGSLWLYPGTGSGGLAARVSKGTGWGGYRELEAVGDVDGDGGTDLVGITSAGALTLLRFSPTGTYLGSRTLATGFGSISSLTGAGDLTGDGRADLVARDPGGTLWLYQNDGTGTFGSRFALGTGWSGATIGS
ncbi:SpoIID/LytB domain protein [Knoellia remsis]|uniref:SpoIID/LytB domain protein n=2 Tax=Knoellia remsis TaxID=407159 RepID=A0A2T0TU38_9MICO|nr:SpoIID/LytB domain protein [Knoellia remsis]